MEENARELKVAMNVLSQLSVSGDAVDLMAAAKHKIRAVIAALEAAPKKEAETDGSGT